MSYLLHLLEDQFGEKTFWNKMNSNPYNTNTLEEIEDNVDNIDMSITSIPSPFARMMLIDSSFSIINRKFENTDQKKELLDGESIYHRLISETLDVYELLFSTDELNIKSKIRIDYWNLSDLETIREQSPGLDNFIESIKLHLDNYKKNQRFEDFDNPFEKITLIYLNDRLIAGSSPYTGFFTSAIEAEKEVGDRLTKRKLTGEYLFKDIVPLYKRSLKFQKFINLFFENQPAIKSSFKYLYNYIKHNRYFCKDIELKENLLNIDNKQEFKDEFNTFSRLSFSNRTIDLIPEIPFVYESISEEDFEIMVNKSDYRIRTRKELVKAPLVFAKNLNKSNWKYLKSTSIPLINFDEKNPIIDMRELPESDGKLYPWITHDDLLTENILDLGYEMRTDKFWTPLDFDSRYLLPVKKAYFDYFTIEDLKENLKMRINTDDSVIVDLTIPTTAEDNRGEVVFTKKYIIGDPYNIQDEKTGTIVESNFFLGIFPFIELPDNYKQYNDFSVISLLTYRENNITLETKVENLVGHNFDTKPSTKFDRTRKDEGLDWTSTYYGFDSNNNSENALSNFFNVIHIQFDNVENSYGAIIPIFNKVDRIISKEKSFISVDFGTSNSYVSVSYDGKNTEDLTSFKSIDKNKELLFVMMHNTNGSLAGTDRFDISEQHYGSKIPADMMLLEFMPSLIANKEKYSFLIPTMINQDNDANKIKEDDVKALINTNIPFAVREIPTRTKMDFVYSNLKWKLQGNEIDEHYIRAKVFLEEMAVIAQKRVLLEGLDPKSSVVLWSKPLSMDDTTSGRIESIWDDLYIKYFSKDKDKDSDIIGITESIAPFYSENFEFGSGEFYLNLDVGGGTTDLILFKAQEPILTTSFKFAGNNLFNSGVHENSSDNENGFVKKYYEIMNNYLNNNGLSEKMKIAKQIKESTKLGSEDLISFYLSIPTFVNMLKTDPSMKLLFLLHNTALFYHSAQILKESGYPIPDNIGFSGMGSKLLLITNGGKDINIPNLLLGVARKTFQFVYETEELPDFKIKMMKNPKRSTAIGAIKGYAKGEFTKISTHENLAKVLIGDANTVINRYGMPKEQVKEFSYGNVLDSKKYLEVTANFKNFVNFFFDNLWYESSINDYFSIDKSLDSEKLKAYMSDEKNINGTLRTIITNLSRKGLKKKPIAESLFFCPLKAFLFEMSKELARGGNEFK